MTETLFEIPQSRHSDPVTSHEAAEAVAAEGTLAGQCEAVYQALKRRPGATSAELAEDMRVSRFLPARRLPDLEHQGRARRGAKRKCSISTTAKGTPLNCVTWEVTEDHE